MQKEFLYQNENRDYKVVVTYKYTRYIRCYYRNNMFKVTAPYMTGVKKIREILDKFYPSLVKRNPRINGIGEDYIYLFGNKIEIGDSGTLILDEHIAIKYKNKDDLKRKLKKYFLTYISHRVRYYESIMHTVSNDVHVREMYTRYGSNSITRHSLSFSFILIHYSREIIDSIVVHELAHCFISGHGEDFYKVVYKYCPNYKELHTKLRKGEFL